MDCRTKDDRRRAAGSGPATTRCLHPVRVRAVHLRADRPSDLPGHAQAEVHSHSGGREQRDVVHQPDAGRRRATEEHCTHSRVEKLHRKSGYDDRVITTKMSEISVSVSVTALFQLVNANE